MGEGGSDLDWWSDISGHSRELEESTLLRLDGIVFVSESSSRDLSWLGGLQNVRSTVVPNFIEASEPTVEPGSLGDLVSIGGLEGRKNQTYLLDVLAGANRLGARYTLDLIGEGSDEPELRKKAERLGLDGQVRLKGFCPDASRCCRVIAATSMLPGWKYYLSSSSRRWLPVSQWSPVMSVESPNSSIPEHRGVSGHLMIPTGLRRFWCTS